MPSPYEEQMAAESAATSTLPAESKGPSLSPYEQQMRDEQSGGLAPTAEGLQRATRAGINVNRPEAEHIALLKQGGYSDAAINQSIQKLRGGQEHQNLRNEGYGAKNTLERFGRQGVLLSDVLPTPASWGIGKSTAKLQQAQKRAAEGNATREDFKLIAYEGQQDEVDRTMGQTLGGKIISVAEGAPKIVGEALLGGAALKGAGQGIQFLRGAKAAAPVTLTGAFSPVAARAALTDPTLARVALTNAGRVAAITPLMPSMYVDEMHQRNLAEGKDANDLSNAPPAMAHAALQVAILGSMQKNFGLTGNVLQKSAVKGGIFAGEQSVADSIYNVADRQIQGANQFNTKYGTLEHLLKGEVGEAAREATVQAFTGALFAGMHEVGNSPASEAAKPDRIERVMKPVLEAFGEDMDALKKTGLNAEGASKRMLETQDMIQEQLQKYHEMAVRAPITSEGLAQRKIIRERQAELRQRLDEMDATDQASRKESLSAAKERAMAVQPAEIQLIRRPRESDQDYKSRVEAERSRLATQQAAGEHAARHGEMMGRVQEIRKQLEAARGLTPELQAALSADPGQAGWAGRAKDALKQAESIWQGEQRPLTAWKVLESIKIARTQKQSSLAARLADALKRADEASQKRSGNLPERMADALKRADELGRQEPPPEGPAPEPAAPKPKEPTSPVSEKPTDLTQTPPPKGGLPPISPESRPASPSPETPAAPEKAPIAEPAKLPEAVPAPESARTAQEVGLAPAPARPKPALTPRQARDQKAKLSLSEWMNLSEDVKSELVKAIRKGLTDPAKIKFAPEKIENPQLAERVRAAGLNDQEVSVMVARAANVPLTDIGREYGFSRERARQIEESAREKLGVADSMAQRGFKPSKERAVAAAVEAQGERGSVKTAEVSADFDKNAPKAKTGKPERSALNGIEDRINALTDQYVKVAESNPKAAEKIAEEIKSLSEEASAIRKFLTEEGGWFTTEWVNKVVDWFKWLGSTGKSKGAGPAVKLDNTNILPRPQENVEYKTIVAEPQGASRIPIAGRILDPGRTDSTPEGKVLVARQALADQGRNIRQLWMTRERVADTLFKADAEGTFALADGSRGHMADVIEAHMRGEKTGLSEEQKAWVDNVWTPLLRDAQKMMADEGVAKWIDENGKVVGTNAKAYFPRRVIGKKGIEDVKVDPSRGERLYESEAEGAKTTIYDPSAKNRVGEFIEGVYRNVADQRLANDPALGGKTIEARYQELLAKNESRIKGLGEKATADLKAELREQAAHPMLGKEAIVRHGPRALSKVIFPIEIAKKIENLYKQEDYAPIKAIEKVSSAAKGIALGLDFGFTTIQLLPTMFTKPIAWGKATYESLRSLADSGRMAKFLENPENAKAARDLTQLGSSIGRLHDSMAGLQQGEFATRLPVVGKAYEAAGRAMSTALDVARIELWKAWSKDAPPEQLRAIAENIDSMLLMGRMESTGLSPRRMLAERLLMNAPAYYRGSLNFIAGAFQRGVSGHMMRTAMAATIGGIVISSYAAMLAAGLPQDEILERFNPARGKFLKVPWMLGDNQKIEIGYSNILTSELRLLGTAADYFASSKPINTGTDGNPILRWLRGKAAFAPRILTDIVTGKDYLGNRVQVHEAVIKAFEPMAVQTLLHGEGSVSEKGFGPTTGQEPSRKNVADAIVSVLGFSSYGGSKTDEKYAVLNDEATKLFGGKKYDELSIPEQARVVKMAKKRPDMPHADPASTTEMERAVALQAERKQKITTMVSKESRSKLTKLDKELPSYLSTISMNGEDVPIGNARLGRYEALLAEEYDRTIGMWNVQQAKSMTPEVRERMMERTLTAAKDRAKRRLIGESH